MSGRGWRYVKDKTGRAPIGCPDDGLACPRCGAVWGIATDDPRARRGEVAEIYCTVAGCDHRWVRRLP